jgi:hypothetical protein
MKKTLVHTLVLAGLLVSANMALPLQRAQFDGNNPYPTCGPNDGGTLPACRPAPPK